MKLMVSKHGTNGFKAWNYLFHQMKPDATYREARKKTGI